MQFIKDGTKIDFIGRQKLFVLISVVVVVLSLVTIATRGLNYGIDFAGGHEILMRFDKPVKAQEIRKVLAEMGLETGVVQSYSEPDHPDQTFYLIRVAQEEAQLSPDQLSTVETALRGQFGEKLKPDGIHYDAEGGEVIELAFTSTVGSAAIENTVQKTGLDVRRVRQYGTAESPVYSVALKGLGAELERRLQASVDEKAEAMRVEFVGPQVGRQLRNQGMMAIIYAMGAILLYIAFRFDFFFSPGAVVALIHDVIITVGVFALLGKEFNLPTIAALLTIVGYSLNDTIVVYDRIRENASKRSGLKLADMVNTSVNETLSRTILTSLTTLLVVIVLLIKGGGVLQDFAFALFVGVIVGTYSSVFIASPTYIFLRRRFLKAETA